MNDWIRTIKRYLKPKQDKNELPSVKIERLVIRTNNYSNQIKFYEQNLGLVILQQTTEQTILGNSDGQIPLIQIVHSTNLNQIKTNTYLHHFGLKVADEQALLLITKHLIEQKIIILGSQDDERSKGIYIRDLDNQLIYIFYLKNRANVQVVPPRTFREGEWFEFSLQTWLRSVPIDNYTLLEAQFYEIGHLHYSVPELLEIETTNFWNNSMFFKEYESFHIRSQLFINHNIFIQVTANFDHSDLTEWEQNIIPIFMYNSMEDLKIISEQYTKLGIIYTSEIGTILSQDVFGFKYKIISDDFHYLKSRT